MRGLSSHWWKYKKVWYDSRPKSYTAYVSHFTSDVEYYSYGPFTHDVGADVRSGNGGYAVKLVAKHSTRVLRPTELELRS